MLERIFLLDFEDQTGGEFKCGQGNIFAVRVKSRRM